MSPSPTRPTSPPDPGQPRESVWDYPRPPRVESSHRLVRVIVDGVAVAETRRAIRVLETSHPPAWYIHPDDVRMDLLDLTARATSCEFKGDAVYHRIRAGTAVREDAAWSYPQPLAGYEAIADHVSFYAGRVDEAWVDGDRVTPQPGDFYGGWITPEIVGPFKGGPRTLAW